MFRCPELPKRVGEEGLRHQRLRYLCKPSLPTSALAVERTRPKKLSQAGKGPNTTRPAVGELLVLVLAAAYCQAWLPRQGFKESLH